LQNALFRLKLEQKCEAFSYWLFYLLSLCGSLTDGLEICWGHRAEHGLAVPTAGVQVCSSAGIWQEMWTRGRWESMGRRPTLNGAGCPLGSHALFPALPQQMLYLKQSILQAPIF